MQQLLTFLAQPERVKQLLGYLLVLIVRRMFFLCSKTIYFCILYNLQTSVCTFTFFCISSKISITSFPSISRTFAICSGEIPSSPETNKSPSMIDFCSVLSILRAPSSYFLHKNTHQKNRITINAFGSIFFSCSKRYIQT